MRDDASFTDVHGIRWTVYEVPASRIMFDDRLVDESPAHLTFEATEGERTLLKRLSDYPPNWRELPDAELEELCTRAGPPPATPSAGESAEVRHWLDEVST